MTFVIGRKCREHTVFIKYYSDLINTLRNTDLTQYFVTESVITVCDSEEITFASSPSVKSAILLRKISAPLEANLTSSFYKMLDIMAEHGNATTKELSAKIRKALQLDQINDGM